MYRQFPTDLNPSQLANWMARLGTLTELGIPLLFIFADGGLLTTIGLVLMVGLHLFITSCFPLAVPLEWNVMMVYGGVVLFGVHSDVMVWTFEQPLLFCWLVGVHLAAIGIGNCFPKRLSFLLSHRYYAGNWAYSVWLFKKGCQEKLPQNLVMPSKLLPDQLSSMYDERTIRAVLSKAQAFRMMHLLGRGMRELSNKSVDNINDYEWIDGEIICGLVLGWNFGDGHLHGPQLLNAIQQACQFEPGELRCVFVESQPIHRREATWKIVDAAEGERSAGSLQIGQLLDGQPWDIEENIEC